MTLHVIANPVLFLLNLFKSFFSLERCLETEAAQNYCLLKWKFDVQLNWVVNRARSFFENPVHAY